MRSSLAVPPRSLVIEVPGLGTTWVDRGPRYWARRFFISFFLIAILALLVAMSAAFVAGVVSGMGWVGHGVVLTLAGSAIVYGCRSPLRWLRQRNGELKAALAGTEDLREIRRSAIKQARKAGASGLGVGALARGGSPIAGAFLFIGALFCLGWLLALAFVSFGRYFNVEEARATAKVEAWRAQQAGA